MVICECKMYWMSSPFLRLVLFIYRGMAHTFLREKEKIYERRKLKKKENGKGEE